MRLEGMHKEGNERLYEKKQDPQYAKAKDELEEMKREMRAKGKEYPVHWDIDGFIPDRW